MSKSSFFVSDCYRYRSWVKNIVTSHFLTLHCNLVLSVPSGVTKNNINSIEMILVSTFLDLLTGKFTWNLNSEFIITELV